ncbi:MAG: serine/threonine protein kinase [Deltaproteobacteria bacterium]|nr:serine/threonine protein kinase [Deltaproteobacteria bacterium]
MTSPAANSWIGTTVGERFRLERPLGEGGMGAVFEAMDLVASERVAIKILRPQLAREEQHLARFRREAEVTGLLEHPHIVGSIAAGTDSDGTPWLAMELVEGETLSSLLRRHGPLAVPDAVALVRQIVAALGAAHEVGVIHRDLKPANVMVTDRSGQRHVTVVDFGIARFVGSAGYEKLTATGIMIGTPSYMAPEQAFGDPIDARADLYCAGSILHTLLTGAPPFGRGQFEEVLPRVMNNDRARLTETRRDLGPIVEVVERCLEYEPEDRYQSAAELDRALAAFDAQKTSVQEWIRPETLLSLVLVPDPVLDAPRARRRPKTTAQRRREAPPETAHRRTARTTGAVAGTAHGPSTAAVPIAKARRSGTGRRRLLYGAGSAVAVACLTASAFGIAFWLSSGSAGQGDGQPASVALPPTAVVPVQVGDRPMRPARLDTTAPSAAPPGGGGGGPTAGEPSDGDRRASGDEPPTRPRRSGRGATSQEPNPAAGETNGEGQAGAQRAEATRLTAAEAVAQSQAERREILAQGARAPGAPVAGPGGGGAGVRVVFNPAPGPVPRSVFASAIGRQERAFVSCLQRTTAPPYRYAFQGILRWTNVEGSVHPLLQFHHRTPPFFAGCIRSTVSISMSQAVPLNTSLAMHFSAYPAPQTTVLVN